MSELVQVILQVVLLVAIGLVVLLNIVALFPGRVQDSFNRADRKQLEWVIAEKERELSELRNRL